jgi:hypothetical protein
MTDLGSGTGRRVSLGWETAYGSEMDGLLEFAVKQLELERSTTTEYSLLLAMGFGQDPQRRGTRLACGLAWHVASPDVWGAGVPFGVGAYTALWGRVCLEVYAESYLWLGASGGEFDGGVEVSATASIRARF